MDQSPPSRSRNHKANAAKPASKLPLQVLRGGVIFQEHDSLALHGLNMKNQGFHKRLGFAINGIATAWRNEHSFKLHIFAALLVVVLLIAVQPDPLWCAVIALTVVGVLAAELFNTAVETLADHLHPQQHPHIKIVKDCAAGAVLLVSLGALGVAAAFAYAWLWQ
jgi:undecaprenol kinase